jgi:pyruvate,orthophosphate dikinase
MILARDEEGRERALEKLLPMQQQDFEGILRAMAGLPVTIRLLDPPLHEFLPHPDDLPEGPQRDRAASLQEVNPMLGTRGCRLGILYPEIYEMQVEAIMRAASAVHERTGDKPHLEVMIPLVDYEREIELLRDYIEQTGEREGLEHPRDYTIGTMIELPRACFLADRIAEFADFFSFGTNDLTQTGLGFSRDDIEGKILGRYIDLKVFDRSPFETIDQPGIGQMLRMGAWLGRKAKPDLKLGVCGEHGGDPDSIEFFHHSGIDYVSCSPYRVPIARVAAAQAAVRDAG